MLGKAKMTLSSIAIDKVAPTRDESKLEHAFTVKAKVSVRGRKLGAVSGEGIESLVLEWKETIDWFERRADGTWQPKGSEKKDMYALNHLSNTFKNWEDMRYWFATVAELNQPPAALTAAVGKVTSTADKDKAAKHWIAENGLEWTIPITDRPALGLKPAASSGGGGGASLVTSNSRRRVIHFDIGFKGSSTRATATQILETADGKPTIHKFIVPGIKKADADDSNKVSAWRAEFGKR
ncbi:hypothetical protein M758_6G076400 [Ceratodon purpureus]|uniref:Uncharacterized protein n=1 Tax=Ceratodon purpureus TaxID=3225 RepID=A0A8T0HF96_CERPU|nr:hypothetical protein KC19_6G081100 [Ceratodon purpureus]KAG0613095.1 hypothetical protein M758_6G076400 [Ceratodon purpureus]